MILRQKAKENEEPQFVAYAKGGELKSIKVFFDGDDFSLFDQVNKKFLQDENGCPFFGLDKAEDLISEYVSNRELMAG